jgi:hypothetical protein
MHITLKKKCILSCDSNTKNITFYYVIPTPKKKCILSCDANIKTKVRKWCDASAKNGHF